MPIELSCTGCGRTLRVADDAAGKHARCPACGQVSRIPLPAEMGVVTAAPVDPREHGVPSGYAPAKPAPSDELAREFGPPASPSPFASEGANPFGDYGKPDSGNPYQAPTAFGYAPPQRATWPLASPGKRLLGYFVDRAIVVASVVPGLILVGIGEETNQEELAIVGAILLWVGVPAVGIVNWVMIAQRGQSIAKRLLRMQMIRIDTGQPAGFVHGVVMRSWILGLAYGVLGMCLLFAPFSLMLFLVDSLLIFGEERRCLHDMIAQTVVIDV